MRGKVINMSRDSISGGITPAYAGKSNNQTDGV